MVVAVVTGTGSAIFAVALKGNSRGGLADEKCDEVEGGEGKTVI